MLINVTRKQLNHLILYLPSPSDDEIKEIIDSGRLPTYFHHLNIIERGYTNGDFVYSWNMFCIKGLSDYDALLIFNCFSNQFGFIPN